MRDKLGILVLFLCSAIILPCIAVAQSTDETGQSDVGTVGAYPGGTVGAYPGAPTPATVQPTQGAYAYPSAPTSVSTGPATGTVSAYPAAPSSAPSTGTITAVYYTQAPPAPQQNVVLTYNIQEAPPVAVYYSGTFIPWTSFYQVFPANSPALWVATSAGWSWYATCPLGSWIQELIYVPYRGTMKLYELYPDGTTKYVSYGWTSPGYKYIWFYADAPGRHIQVITLSDNPSNYITIDVF